jgi:hypothetical protein
MTGMSSREQLRAKPSASRAAAAKAAAPGGSTTQQPVADSEKVRLARALLDRERQLQALKAEVEQLQRRRSPSPGKPAS